MEVWCIRSNGHFVHLSESLFLILQTAVSSYVPFVSTIIDGADLLKSRSKVRSDVLMNTCNVAALLQA
jgi:hypothetical protein